MLRYVTWMVSDLEMIQPQIRVFFGIHGVHAPKKGAYIQASEPWVYTRARKLLERLYRHSEILGENP